MRGVRSAAQARHSRSTSRPTKHPGTGRSPSRFPGLIFTLALVLLARPVEPARTTATVSPYPNVQLLATLANRAIDESSGLMLARAAGREPDELFWTHNDSGDGPYLYLFDRRGRDQGRWRVTGATSRDVEECAAGPGPDRGRRYLYFADIGDNFSLRTDCVIWRIPEPSIPADAGSGDREHATATTPAAPLAFGYPDGAHDCEAMFVHPESGDIYLVTKEFGRASSGVYKFPRPRREGQRETLVKVGEVTLGSASFLEASLVTAADVSPDGKRVILRDYQRLYEYTLPAGASSFDAIWKQKPRVFASPQLAQGEAVCYGSDGESLYMTSERLPTPLYVIKR